MKKFSRKRQAILEKIMSTDTHPTAAWVYEQLKPAYPDLSLATVYRNISEFVREGTVVSVGTVDGQERYDGNTVPHTHFVCTKCGSVLDLFKYDSVIPDEKVAEETGFLITRHELVFKGICKGCK